MKNIVPHILLNLVFSVMILSSIGCERDISELKDAEYSNTPDVFLDDFSSGLNYSAFGNSNPKAFDVDSQIKYSGTKSMRFEVPDYGSAEGAYAGGSFYTSTGRDLSGYNCLTFWIKATQPATIDVIGFGNDLGQNKYQTSINGLAVNTNWKKVYIPIPDPSKLKAERGMLFYSEGPENNKGYTFWIDEVKFENLPGIAHPAAAIFDGVSKTVTSFVGVNQVIDGLQTVFNLPNGVNQSVVASPYYFNFISSDTSVATVSETGKVSTIGAGSAVITAKLGDQIAKGNLTINSSGRFIAAPKPTIDPSKVISLFSDAYSNVPVEFFNGYWEPYQTTKSADFVVNDDHVLNYFNFNFVGIQFSSPTIDASNMSHLNVDIYLPSNIQAGATFKVNVVDFGADGVYGGGDDSNHVTTFSAPTLQGQKWISLMLPFKTMSGLKARKHLGQIIFEGAAIPSFYADNIFFYNDGSIIFATPTAAAPTPTAAASDVLSVFSDAYNNISGTDFNPNWGQNTQVSQVPIAGNNTLKYAGLNFQGTQFASPLNVSTYGYIHLDYYSANSTDLKFYLISDGPAEKAYALPVPTGVGGNANGWKSIDIPLTAFSSVNLAKVIQFKVDGNGDIFFDNIYFHK